MIKKWKSILVLTFTLILSCEISPRPVKANLIDDVGGIIDDVDGIADQFGEIGGMLGVLNGTEDIFGAIDSAVEIYDDVYSVYRRGKNIYTSVEDIFSDFDDIDGIGSIFNTFNKGYRTWESIKNLYDWVNNALSPGGTGEICLDEEPGCGGDGIGDGDGDGTGNGDGDSDGTGNGDGDGDGNGNGNGNGDEDSPLLAESLDKMAQASQLLVNSLPPPLGGLRDINPSSPQYDVFQSNSTLRRRDLANLNEQDRVRAYSAPFLSKLGEAWMKREKDTTAAMVGSNFASSGKLAQVAVQAQSLKVTQDVMKKNILITAEMGAMMARQTMVESSMKDSLLSLQQLEAAEMQATANMSEALDELNRGARTDREILGASSVSGYVHIPGFPYGN